jgi:hypothetical protein
VDRRRSLVLYRTVVHLDDRDPDAPAAESQGEHGADWSAANYPDMSDVWH